MATTRYWKWLSLPLLLLLVGGQPARGQGADQACGNGRYSADVFAAVTQTSGLTYGLNSVRDYSANGGAGADAPVTLQLDFYEPTGDPAPQRPLIIFAFGGSFVGGQRQDLDDLCRAFARKGYATATIDYRLIPAGAGFANYFLVLNSPALIADQIVRASSDMKAAVRFFRHDAATTNAYRIDPTRIFVGGYSAGAFTALQTAYIDSPTEDGTFTAAYQANGGLEGNTDLPAPNNLLPAYNASGLAGVLNLAGAVVTPGVVSAGNPPLFSAHGTADTTVPYNSGPALGNPSFMVYGSGLLAPQATSVGVANLLYTIPSGSHSSPRQEPNATAINTAAADFFQSIICPAALPVTLTSFSGQLLPGTCAATLRWRTASEVASQTYEVQRSADGQHFVAVGQVPSRNSVSGGSYSYAVGPLGAPAYFRLRMLDVDGSSAYSPVVRLAATCAAPTFAPNPTPDRLTVGGLPAEVCRAEVYAATGRRVAAATGAGQLTLDLSALPAGLYWVSVSTEAGQWLGRSRVVKQ